MAAKSWLLAAALNALSESLSRPMTAVNFACHFWLSDARAFMETVGLVETSTTPARRGAPTPFPTKVGQHSPGRDRRSAHSEDSRVPDPQ